jgi:hypothetical protein
MIQAKELRIGNYLLNYENKVIRINKWDFVGYRDNYGNIYSFDKSNPIPIDEKWLTDFGFRDLNYVFVLNASRKKLLVNWSTRIVSSNIRNGFYLNKYKHIKYIHQLQNLYFALTGKELQLKDNTK